MSRQLHPDSRLQATKKLELSFCKKRRKNSNQETSLENRGRLKVLNDIKLIPNDWGQQGPGGHFCSFMNNLLPFINIQTSPIPQTSFLVGNLFCLFLQQDSSRFMRLPKLKKEVKLVIKHGPLIRIFSVPKYDQSTYVFKRPEGLTSINWFYSSYN